MPDDDFADRDTWHRTLKRTGQRRAVTKPNGRLKWAAQFAVASELCKRGYEVAFTSGHTTPVADLMVVSPEKKEMFLVDVKGLYRMNPWIIKMKPPMSNLFFILAYVPSNEPNQFFVMKQQQVAQLIREELRRLGRPEEYPMTGFSWKLGLRFKDAWDVLPKLIQN